MTAAAPTPKTPLQAAQRMAASAVRDGFQFQAMHEFTDAAGQALHWRIRLKHPGTGEKWIRPMQRFGDGFKPGDPKYPDGKPLYRLHELAARPDGLVIVTEGEFKADKLAVLGLEAKGDAADWMAAHPDATAADVLALALECLPDLQPQGSDAGSDLQPPALAGASASATKAEPNTCKYGGGLFKLTVQGVFFIGQDDDGNDKAPVWICSPIGVIAKTGDAKSGEWGRLLEWFDDDGVGHQWAMPLELLEGGGIDFRRELARLGLHIGTSRQARDLLAAYVKVWPVHQRARCVHRLGWHGTVFATPAETIGEVDELVVFQNAHAIEPALRVAGTVDDWRNTVAALAIGNTRLVFALSLAFAGTLANIVGEDSGGCHLRGKSSSGKSTALKVAASAWGQPSA